MASFFKDGQQEAGVLKTMIREIIHRQKAAQARSDSVGEWMHTSLPQQAVIPIILYSLDNMTPFVGAGFSMQTDADGKHYYECVESPIFKATDFVWQGEESWVQLKLLRPVVESDGLSTKMGCQSAAHPSFCDNYGIEKITRFKETDVSITVSLARFGGITCLARATSHG